MRLNNLKGHNELRRTVQSADELAGVTIQRVQRDSAPACSARWSLGNISKRAVNLVALAFPSLAHEISRRLDLIGLTLRSLPYLSQFVPFRYCFLLNLPSVRL